MAFTFSGVNINGSLRAAYIPPLPVTYYGLWTAGNNDSGQLGLGNLTAYSSPKQIGSLTNWAAAAGSSNGTAAIDSSNKLWTWGTGTTGGLGLGDTNNRSSPTQVGALTNWSKISGGEASFMSIKTDGTLWGWGNGRFGKLGLGNTTYYSSPKQVGSLSNWASIYSGTWNSFAIKTDNTAWVWGYNLNGQLGLNDVTDRSSPVQLGSAGEWSSFSIGNGLAHGIKTDGSMWAWGYNGAGNLGLGTTTADRSSPVQIGTLTTWLQVACSRYGSLAIKTDGTLWGWGKNQFGQLGIGDTVDRSSPVQVGALSNWSKLPRNQGAQGFSLAIKTNGTLWAWGNGTYGRLGLNSTAYYSSPVQVGALTTWYDVDRTNFTMVALKT